MKMAAARQRIFWKDTGKVGRITHRKDFRLDVANYVLSGTGLVVTDGIEEPLSAGVCHVYKKVQRKTNL